MVSLDSLGLLPQGLSALELVERLYYLLFCVLTIGLFLFYLSSSVMLSFFWWPKCLMC